MLCRIIKENQGWAPKSFIRMASLLVVAKTKELGCPDRGGLRNDHDGRILVLHCFARANSPRMQSSTTSRSARGRLPSRSASFASMVAIFAVRTTDSEGNPA